MIQLEILDMTSLKCMLWRHRSSWYDVTQSSFYDVPRRPLYDVIQSSDYCATRTSWYASRKMHAMTSPKFLLWRHSTSLIWRLSQDFRSLDMCNKFVISLILTVFWINEGRGGKESKERKLTKRKLVNEGRTEFYAVVCFATSDNYSTIRQSLKVKMVGKIVLCKLTQRILTVPI